MLSDVWVRLAEHVTLVGCLLLIAPAYVALFWLLWPLSEPESDEQGQSGTERPEPHEPHTEPIPRISTDTAESHPADTFARQQHVLANGSTASGRHRHRA